MKSLNTSSCFNPTRWVPVSCFSANPIDRIEPCDEEIIAPRDASKLSIRHSIDSNISFDSDNESIDTRIANMGLKRRLFHDSSPVLSSGDNHPKAPYRRSKLVSRARKLFSFANRVTPPNGVKRSAGPSSKPSGINWKFWKYRLSTPVRLPSGNSGFNAPTAPVDAALPFSPLQGRNNDGISSHCTSDGTTIDLASLALHLAMAPSPSAEFSNETRVRSALPELSPLADGLYRCAQKMSRNLDNFVIPAHNGSRASTRSHVAQIATIYSALPAARAANQKSTPQKQQVPKPSLIGVLKRHDTPRPPSPPKRVQFYLPSMNVGSGAMDRCLPIPPGLPKVPRRVPAPDPILPDPRFIEPLFVSSTWTAMDGDQSSSLSFRPCSEDVAPLPSAGLSEASSPKTQNENAVAHVSSDNKHQPLNEHFVSPVWAAMNGMTNDPVDPSPESLLLYQRFDGAYGIERESLSLSREPTQEECVASATWTAIHGAAELINSTLCTSHIATTTRNAAFRASSSSSPVSETGRNERVDDGISTYAWGNAGKTLRLRPEVAAKMGMTHQVHDAGQSAPAPHPPSPTSPEEKDKDNDKEISDDYALYVWGNTGFKMVLSKKTATALGMTHIVHSKQENSNSINVTMINDSQHEDLTSPPNPFQVTSSERKQTAFRVPSPTATPVNSPADDGFNIPSLLSVLPKKQQPFRSSKISLQELSQKLCQGGGQKMKGKERGRARNTSPQPLHALYPFLYPKPCDS